MPGVALPDYAHARLIVLWGLQPVGVRHPPRARPSRRRSSAAPGWWSSTRAARRSPSRPTCTWRCARAATCRVALSVIRWLFESGRADLDFLAAHATGGDELRRRAAAWTFERAAEAAGVAGGAIEAFARLYADVARRR